VPVLEAFESAGERDRHGEVVASSTSTNETASRRVEIAPESNRKWVAYVTPGDTLFVQKWPGSISLY
jgi:hypothetical protein